MLDANLKIQLATYLQHIVTPVELSLSLDDSAKARELSGQSNLLFLRNSVTGAVEARPRDGHGIVLNSDLHAND